MIIIFRHTSSLCKTKSKQSRRSLNLFDEKIGKRNHNNNFFWQFNERTIYSLYGLKWLPEPIDNNTSMLLNVKHEDSRIRTHLSYGRNKRLHSIFIVDIAANVHIFR